MKIAIHNRLTSFSERWIECCKQKNIDYKLVNAYDSNIVEHLADCDVFLWHHSHVDYRDALFAKQLLYSIEATGKKVFPDFNTGWYFDDKVGQKYLLESVGAALVPSYVFYTKSEALHWISKTTFPKVFKLRGGAGAANVKLLRNASEARRLVRKAFGRGFPQFDRREYFKERLRKFTQRQDSFIGVLKALARQFIPTEFSKLRSPEKGYVYFQDFIENNSYDIRVIVIGDKAFSIKRLVRKGDFRASGSGYIIFEKEQLSEDAVRISFEVASKLRSKCMGFDFVFSPSGPLIVEMGFGFAPQAYDDCEGYWTDDMQWHAGKFNPQEWILEDLLS